MFFNKSTIHASLVRHNADKTRASQIAAAQHALERLGIEISFRQQKLDTVLSFLKKKKHVAQQLRELSIADPLHEDVADRLTCLLQKINQLKKKIQDTQPEKYLANLKIQYNTLQKTLSIKSRDLSALT